MVTISTVCLFVLFLSMYFSCDGEKTNNEEVKPKRPKPKPQNVKSKVTPPLVLYGAYMGDITLDYDYVELTIESMRWNPQVDFILLNIVKHESEAKRIRGIKDRLHIRNLYIKVLSVEDFVERVNLRFGIDIPMNYTAKWGRKLADFKPVFGYLYPEFIREEHQYWGFIDYDVIWGNFNAYADWFVSKPPAIFSQVHVPGGFLTLIRLHEPWSLKIGFKYITDKRDDIYLELLKNVSHHCLDEDGKQTDRGEDAVFHEHAFFSKMSDIEAWSGWKERIQRVGDFDFLLYGDAHKTMWGNWGPVRWFRGALHVVLGSRVTAPERELLMFHRPFKKIFLHGIPDKIKARVVKDMIKYGYFLPNWLPIHTRFVGRDVALLKNLTNYAPHSDLYNGPLNNVRIDSTK